ncbi:hypothetical protein [Persicitalea jodogahamensis]|uniref:Uncharacterized protein n=1 Tax=Persicitalea jodogahamensis TaxID=402147 RepID=A0A8J3D732_9BACT|nr:hypothetical protein [Persicitalea jodogahamensis]GHB83851.1 hypothetical protein GCM10007390_43750 [Persicitalea jodogahamensis]
MTNSIDLAKNIVDRLVMALPTIKCRYEYRDYSDTHMIEVLPLSVYDSEAFENAAEPLLMEFISQFMGESLCFISDESLSSIKNSMYEAQGKAYLSSGLYQAAKPSSVSKNRIEVRIDSDFFKGLPEKISASDNINPGEAEYAMAA